ncbi:hypothetical protein V8E36_009167 [Tilletia maclaganii]
MKPVELCSTVSERPASMRLPTEHVFPAPSASQYAPVFSHSNQSRTPDLDDVLLLAVEHSASNVSGTAGLKLRALAIKKLSGSSGRNQVCKDPIANSPSLIRGKYTSSLCCPPCCRSLFRCSALLTLLSPPLSPSLLPLSPSLCPSSFSVAQGQRERAVETLFLQPRTAAPGQQLTLFFPLSLFSTYSFIILIYPHRAIHPHPPSPGLEPSRTSPLKPDQRRVETRPHPGRLESSGMWTDGEA